MITRIMDLDQPLLLVVETSYEGEDLEKVLTKVKEQVKERLKDYNVEVIAIPSYMQFKAITAHGVYHRENYGDYEVEIFAKNEEDLKKRLELIDKISPVGIDELAKISDK